MKRGPLISIVAIIILIASWYYIKNQTKLLSSTNTYFAYYDDAKGIQESSSVYLKGVRVGKIKSVSLNKDQKIEVVFAIGEHLKFPNGTAAIIGVGDFNGNRSIHLEPGPGPGLLPNNGVLAAGFDTTMIENFDAKITPLLHNGKTLLRNTDSALNSFNQIITRGLGFRAREDIAKFQKVTNGLVRTTGSANMRLQHLHPTITKLDSATKNPDKVNADLNKSLAANESKTREIANKQMHKDLEETRASVNKLMSSISSLRENKLLTDKTPYVETVHSIDTFNQSMENYQKAPPSPIKIFSGKSK